MRDKILAMEAGKELNALVAEKVMGWRDVRSMTNTSNNCTSMQGFPPNHYSIRKIPNYSTDISAAMEALDELKDNYDAVNLVYCDGSWQCILTTITGSAEEVDGDFNVSDISYDSPSLPEAICIAALLAVIKS